MDLEKGELLMESDESSGDGYVYSVAFSTDGRWLCRGTGEEEAKTAGVAIFDASSGEMVHFVAVGSVFSMAFTPSGMTLLHTM